MKKTAVSNILLLASVAVIAAPLALFRYNVEKPVPASATPGDSLALNKKDTSIVFPKRPTLAPALLVKQTTKDTGSGPLGIHAVAMHVKVLGNIATTKMELTFYNHTNRVLEGEFVCPLGEGQNMSYFAFETDGALREGVVVDKTTGRQVFESVVRRNIDPGLLEWTKGNNFSSRIYPIPAHGYKKVIIGFDQELVATGRSAIYLQPLLFKDKLSAFDLDVEVVRQEVKPTLYGDERVNLEFAKWKESWKASQHLENTTMLKPVGIEIPVLPNGNVYTQAIDMERSYVYAVLQPDKYIVPKKQARKLCVVWDVSGSAASRDTTKEFALLDAYLKQLGTGTVELLTFSNAVQDKKNYKITGGNWSALKDELRREVYDGGTQLGALDLKGENADEYLLFSDGLSNFGRSDLQLPDKVVYTISSSSQADFSMLKYLAQKSGGDFINLQNTTAADALKQISQAPYQFLYATYDTNAVAQVYPSLPHSIVNGLSVSGILKQARAEVTLHFGAGGVVMHEQKIVLQKENPVEGESIGRQWAQQQINELDLNNEANSEAITRLGKTYSIVTRYTSLLILDRLEDYITYRIVPPTENMKREYYAAVRKESEQKASARKEHLDNVWQQYQELRDWYAKDFKAVCATTTKMKEGRNTVEMGDGTPALDMRGSRASDEVVQFAPPVTTELNEVSVVTGGAPANYSSVTSGVVSISSSNALAATYSWDANKAGEKKQSDREAPALQAKIELKDWDPQTPYMTALKKAEKTQVYKTYLGLRQAYSSTPAFYVDVADYLLKIGEKEAAMRVLSNIAELETENHQLLRVLAHRLQQMQEYELAIAVYKDILKIRSEEPQSYRDLGLAYAQHKDYQLAVNSLCRVVNKTWDGRFPGIEVIAINEINNVASKDPDVKLDSLETRFRKPLQADVRVVINWDSDNCDMDLWVTDPCFEKCFYGNKLTAQGGRLSNDFTGGYGPEEFLVKKGVAGKYLVQVNYFGTREQTLYGPTTVQAELYTNYGRPNEIRKDITLRLSENKEVIDLGSLAFTK